MVLNVVLYYLAGNTISKVFFFSELLSFLNYHIYQHSFTCYPSSSMTRRNTTKKNWEQPIQWPVWFVCDSWPIICTCIVCTIIQELTLKTKKKHFSNLCLIYVPILKTYLMSDIPNALFIILTRSGPPHCWIHTVAAQGCPSWTPQLCGLSQVCLCFLCHLSM